MAQETSKGRQLRDHSYMGLETSQERNAGLGTELWGSSEPRQELKLKEIRVHHGEGRGVCVRDEKRRGAKKGP